LRDRLAASALLSPGVRISRAVAEELGRLRTAIREKRKIRFEYVDKGGSRSSRVIWPLAMAFWGKSWSVAGYCELRQDFRNFNAERVNDLMVLDDRFEDVPGRTLHDLIDHYEDENRRR
jgi:predicted DNA-binding transcriptional regulator YafY